MSGINKDSYKDLIYALEVQLKNFSNPRSSLLLQVVATLFCELPPSSFQLQLA